MLRGMKHVNRKRGKMGADITAWFGSADSRLSKLYIDQWLEWTVSEGRIEDASYVYTRAHFDPMQNGSTGSAFACPKNGLASLSYTSKSHGRVTGYSHPPFPPVSSICTQSLLITG